MDALSKIFDDIHLNHSEYLYLQAQGDWAFHSCAQDAVITHIVLYGTAHLQFSKNLTIDLNTGDMILIPAGLAHSVSNQIEHKLLESLDIAPLFCGLRQDAIEFGQGSNEKTLILTVRCHLNAIMKLVKKSLKYWDVFKPSPDTLMVNRTISGHYWNLIQLKVHDDLSDVFEELVPQ